MNINEEGLEKAIKAYGHGDMFKLSASIINWDQHVTYLTAAIEAYEGHKVTSLNRFEEENGL